MLVVQTKEEEETHDAASGRTQHTTDLAILAQLKM